MLNSQDSLLHVEKKPPCIKTNFKRIFLQSRFKQIVRKFIFVQNTID